jgi:hypothetical protein
MTNPRQIGKHVYGVRHCVIKSEWYYFISMIKKENSFEK